MKYRVKHHLKFDGKEYGPGDAITVTDAEAAQCGSALEAWSADEAAEQAEKKKNESKVRSKSSVLDEA